MGVDYVPTRKEIELYSINWPGHEFMGRSLDLLGADLTKWSGSNDGSFVPSAICREWARLLRIAVTEDRIRLATVKGVRGRERQVPVVDGAATRLGSLSADLESIDVAFGGDRFVPDMPTFPMDATRSRLIVGFADFLAGCGGCRQW